MGSHWLGPMSLTGSTNYTGMSLDDHTIDATPQVPQGNAPPPVSALVTWYENAAHEITSPAGAGPSNGAAVRPSHACTMHPPPASVAYVHFSLFHCAACRFGHEAFVILICRYSPLMLLSRSLAVSGKCAQVPMSAAGEWPPPYHRPSPRKWDFNRKPQPLGPVQPPALYGAQLQEARSNSGSLPVCMYVCDYIAVSLVRTLTSPASWVRVGMQQGQVSLRPFTCTAYIATEAFETPTSSEKSAISASAHGRPCPHIAASL